MNISTAFSDSADGDDGVIDGFATGGFTRLLRTCFCPRPAAGLLAGLGCTQGKTHRSLKTSSGALTKDGKSQTLHVHARMLWKWFCWMARGGQLPQHLMNSERAIGSHHDHLIDKRS